MNELARIDGLIAAGQLASARELLGAAIDRGDAPSEFDGRLIDVCLSMGDTAAALVAALAYVARKPHELDAFFYLAKCELSSGNLAAARKSLDEISKKGADRFAAYHLLSARIYAGSGDRQAAVGALRMAVQIDNLDPEPWMMLAQLFLDAGDTDASTHAWAQFAQRSRRPDAWVHVGRVHAKAGDVSMAVQSYRAALSLDADHPDALRALGFLAAETFDFETAKNCLVRLLSPSSPDEAVLSLLGSVLAELGEDALAIATLRMNEPAAPSPSRRAKQVLYLPQVTTSSQQIADLREKFKAGLQELENDARWISSEAELFSLGHSNFLLAYHGQNDLPLQTRFGALIRNRIARVAPQWLEPLQRTRGKRIRVGFLSSFFRQCTIGHYFEHWLTGLDPQIFERHVYSTGWHPDALGERLRAAVDHFELLRGGALEVARRVKDAGLDILIYPEVGMGALNCLLAHLRLAPVQCTAWGHPITTGSASMDVFFSCADMEPDDASAHYAERLIGLPGIGTYYQRPAEVPSFVREALKLGPNTHVYVCPQSLFKIHPDNDDLFLRIVEQDRFAVILFFQAISPAVSAAFSARLARSAKGRGIDVRGRFRFVPRQSEAGFRSILGQCDVVLDTQHWSGGNTSLDALAVAAPTVTLPGEFMRGRQTMAMLRQAGIPELIAADQADYVHKAINIASNSDWRMALRTRLKEGSSAVFGQRMPILALGEHLQALART